jgi:hypothetical protein
MGWDKKCCSICFQYGRDCVGVNPEYVCDKWEPATFLSKKDIKYLERGKNDKKNHSKTKQD